MAKPNAAKSAKPALATAAKVSKFPALITTISYFFCVVLLATLFASRPNIDLLHSAHMLEKYNLALIAGFVIFSAVVFVMNSKLKSAAHLNVKQFQQDAREQADQLIARADEKIEKYLGSEYERLVAENENYKLQIEKADKEKEADLAVQIDELRKKNTELQEQINNWTTAQQIRPQENSTAQLPQEDQLRVG